MIGRENQRTDVGGTGDEAGAEGRVEPSIAQRLAEELVADMVRQRFDVVGMLELERDVIDALGGPPLDPKGHPTPMAILASVLIDQAFHRIQAEWRESRVLAAAGECVCCAVEQSERRRKTPKGGAS